MKTDSILTFVKYALIAFVGFFAPIQGLILGCGALIVLDTITGIYKANKLGEKITSFRFGNIISKMLLYNIAIVSGFIVQKLFDIDIFHLAQIITCAIALTELKSIGENVNAVTGIDIWKFAMNYLKRQKSEISEVMTDTENKS